MYKYHPETLELINSDFKLDWALTTDITPPQMSNCFFVNGAWEIRPDYVEPPKSYKELRAFEYPPMADYLDAVVKGDLVGQQAYIDACLAVKAKYPKEVI